MNEIDEIDNAVQRTITREISLGVAMSKLFPHGAERIRDINQKLESLSDHWRLFFESMNPATRINAAAVIQAIEATKRVVVVSRAELFEIAMERGATSDERDRCNAMVQNVIDDWDRMIGCCESFLTNAMNGQQPDESSEKS